MKNIFYFLYIFSLFLFTGSVFASTNSPNFLVISDIHLDQSFTHTMDINPLKPNKGNDLDPVTFENLIEKLSINIKNGLIPQPDFIIILGDIVGHIRSSSNSVSDSESAVFKTLTKTFSTTPLLYIFGNNDSFQKNYGPFKPKDMPSPYEIAIENGWKNGFLSTGEICHDKKNHFPCIIIEEKNDGYYTAYLRPKLRLIALNSILFSENRNNMTEKNAEKELLWLSAQLNIAQKKHESVLISMHIPPGNNVYDNSNFWMPKDQENFLNILKIYQSNIIGLLASHTHADELKIIKDSSGKNIAGIYFTPALSTSHGNAASIKTFYFSHYPKNWALSNYDVFYFTKNNDQLILNKLYNYRSYYCPHQPHNLFNCLGKVTADKMKKYFSAGNPNFEGIMNSPQDIFLTIQ